MMCWGLICLPQVRLHAVISPEASGSLYKFMQNLLSKWGTQKSAPMKSYHTPQMRHPLLMTASAKVLRITIWEYAPVMPGTLIEKIQLPIWLISLKIKWWHNRHIISAKADEPLQRTSKLESTKKKLMQNLWCAWKGILSYELLQPGEKVNSEIYCPQWNSFPLIRITIDAL